MILNKELEANIVDIKRFAVHDGPGTRTTIFFKGCSLKCAWCHNPESISFSKELSYSKNICQLCGMCNSRCDYDVFSLDGETNNLNRSNCVFCGKCVDACSVDALQIFGREYSTKQLMDIVLEDDDFYKISGGGVTLSGGEPLMQPKFAAAFLEECKKHGINTAVDTCGNVPYSSFLQVADYTDIFLYDLKLFDSDLHRKYTGIGNELILDNIKKLSALGKPIEVRMIILPGINSNRLFIEGVARLLCDIKTLTRVKLLPYHDYARSKFRAIGTIDTMPNIDKPTDELMEGINDILSRFGLKVYIG